MAVDGDMRPGSEVRVVTYPEPSSSSIPKLAWNRYSRSEATARLAVTAEAMNVNRGLASAIPRSASPTRIKPAAVLRCIGGRLGVT